MLLSFPSRHGGPVLSEGKLNASELLGRVRTPDGTDMTLMRRGGEYVILADGKALMSSRMHGSEEALATYGCERARRLQGARVLVGGLGMGFSLRATLDLLPSDARVVVAELLPSVVEWNRGVLGTLADHPLRDRRVTVELSDVGKTLRDSSGRFHAVLLDVDNGPSAFAQTGNGSLYSDAGLALTRAALKPLGSYAVWSARRDVKFEHRLRYNGFRVETHEVRGRLKKGGPRHTIFVGTL
jgi:spermidine synthase